MKKENIWNIPNILTMLRILLIGVLIYFFSRGQLYAALGTFLLAGFTDFLDGYIARKKQLITNFGKVMDPFADKLMLITTLICLTDIGKVSLWVVIVVTVKEALMLVGGAFLLKRKVVVQAQPVGKVATVMFIIAVAAVFFSEYVSPWDEILMDVAVLLTILAFVWYLRQLMDELRRAKHAK